MMSVLFLTQKRKYSKIVWYVMEKIENVNTILSQNIISFFFFVKEIGLRKPFSQKKMEVNMIMNRFLDFSIITCLIAVIVMCIVIYLNGG